MAEATVAIEAYRDVITLKDGVQVLLRPMAPGDGEALMRLFASASDEDVRYLRHNIRDASVVRRWCESLDYQQVLPLMALVNDRAVGQASLHFGSGPERHIGQARLFVARDFRRHGLGAAMLNALIGLARQRGLHLVAVEIVADQTHLIRACLKLGFELCSTLKDSFMLPNGSTRGVTILRLCLQPPCDEFGLLTEA